jgi:crotonobetainyl-CoA:carnitine CoA-transferase CaiB-like acyl-CoA transferase
MSGGETGTRRPSPALGQHTREVLAELGYEAGEIEALIAQRVVRAWEPPAGAPRD